MSCKEQSLPEQQKLAHQTPVNTDLLGVKEVGRCDSSLNSSSLSHSNSKSKTLKNGAADQPEQGVASCLNAHESDVVKDEDRTNPNTEPDIQYQQLVEKLHKLGNESTDTADNPSTEVLASNSTGPLNNGIAKTPPSSPVTCISDCDSKDKDVLVSVDDHGIHYVHYQSELEMPNIMSLISKDLSEPYSIYTYRYFIHNWPDLCFLALDRSATVGAIVCKLDAHKRTLRKRGYIAMLAVADTYRRKKIGSKLVSVAIEAMIAKQADEIVLETEVTNLSALRLYEKLGFVRDKRLYKYYLNGVDAFRLKLWLT